MSSCRDHSTWLVQEPYSAGSSGGRQVLRWHSWQWCVCQDSSSTHWLANYCKPFPLYTASTIKLNESWAHLSAFSMARGWQFLFTKNTCPKLFVVDEVTKTGKEHNFFRPNGAAKTPLPLPYALLPKAHATNLWCQSSILNLIDDFKELAVIKIWLKMYELWQSNKFSKHETRNKIPKDVKVTKVPKTTVTLSLWDLANIISSFQATPDTSSNGWSITTLRFSNICRQWCMSGAHQKKGR